jgi:hypothetical protein
LYQILNLFPTHFSNILPVFSTGLGIAFYTYSNERYEPCLFPNGEWCGSLEQAIAICEVYL